MNNSKTIGILTLQNSNNYGAMYQAYALSKYLKNQGNNVFILNYEMTRDNSNIFDYLKNPISFIQKVFLRKEQIINKLLNKNKSTPTISREKKFIEIFKTFRESYLNITNTEYNSKILNENCPDADVYICGSDQIWAADFLFTSPAFLLGFVPSDTKRVSYAGSFGKNSIEPYLEKTFIKYINKFDAISVREKSGIDIVEKFSNLDTTHVLDPTLLLDKSDYSEILDYTLVPDEPYVFVYKLNQTKELSDWMDICINNIGDTKNLSIVAVSTNLIYPFDVNWKVPHPTPGQLLGLIEKSSITITNSFHGTVFSIILQTNFLSIARDKYTDKQNVRMEELLSSLDLENNYCKPFLDQNTVYEKIDRVIDYKKVSEKLTAMKLLSETFLTKSIK
jgi:hypothetical protein